MSEMRRHFELTNDQNIKTGTFHATWCGDMVTVTLEKIYCFDVAGRRVFMGATTAEIKAPLSVRGVVGCIAIVTNDKIVIS
jgi:hypothetical protein